LLLWINLRNAESCAGIVDLKVMHGPVALIDYGGLDETRAATAKYETCDRDEGKRKRGPSCSIGTPHSAAFLSSMRALSTTPLRLS
jgi:hypothetical protein